MISSLLVVVILNYFFYWVLISCYQNWCHGYTCCKCDFSKPWQCRDCVVTRTESLGMADVAYLTVARQNVPVAVYQPSFRLAWWLALFPSSAWRLRNSLKGQVNNIGCIVTHGSSHILRLWWTTCRLMQFTKIGYSAVCSCKRKLCSINIIVALSCLISARMHAGLCSGLQHLSSHCCH